MNTNKIIAKKLPPGIAALALATLCSYGPFAAPTLAQGPEGGPPAMNGFDQGPGGPPPRGGFDRRDGGRPPMMGRDWMGRGPARPMPISAASVPLDAMGAALKLSEDQKQKISAIQAHFQSQRAEDQNARPGQRRAPGGQGPAEHGPTDGRPMDFEAGYATAKIEDVLSAGQRSQLGILVDTLNKLRSVGIPPTLYASLKLTPDQTTRLATLAKTAGPPFGAGPEGLPDNQGRFDEPGGRPPMRGPRGAATSAILSTAQNAQLAAYQLSHPRPERPEDGPDARGFRQDAPHDDDMPPPPDDQGPPRPDNDQQQPGPQ